VAVLIGVVFAGWLLTTCTNPVAASNAKLALFYDWLFFDAEKVYHQII
jgi:hypothetical protein